MPRHDFSQLSKINTLLVRQLKVVCTASFSTNQASVKQTHTMGLGVFNKCSDTVTQSKQISRWSTKNSLCRQTTN